MSTSVTSNDLNQHIQGSVSSSFFTRQIYPYIATDKVNVDRYLRLS